VFINPGKLPEFLKPNMGKAPDRTLGKKKVFLGKCPRKSVPRKEVPEMGKKRGYQATVVREIHRGKKDQYPFPLNPKIRSFLLIPEGINHQILLVSEITLSSLALSPSGSPSSPHSKIP